MGILEAVMLVLVGVAGGTVTALIGGASLITFPALIATGLSPVGAVVVNLIALMPANLSAAWWDRTQMPPFDRSFIWMLVISTVGSLLGAALLMATPDRMFATLVPLLLALSTVLFAFSGRIARWIERNAADPETARKKRWDSTAGAMVPISIYGGYFGAGAGVMLLGVLSVGAGGDYRVANAAKNLISGLNCIVAALVYIVQGAVVWPPVLLMMAGGLVGAVIGIRIARVVHREVMRIAIVAVSTLLTVVFTIRYWL